MKKLCIIMVFIAILTGCTAKYSLITSNDNVVSMTMENYVVIETTKYNSTGQVIAHKKTMMPYYEGVFGKFIGIFKPILEFLKEDLL